jgi:hypothetical protein
MAVQKWTTLPEVAEQTEGRIRIGYTGLPQGLDPDQLQLNTRAAYRSIIGWGGYETTSMSAYQGDADIISTEGMPDASGAGLSVGAAAISRAESGRNSSDSDRKNNILAFRNGDLAIQWNITALNNRLPVDQQFNPHARAKQLDNIIRKNAIAGVWRHNTIETISNAPPQLLVATLAMNVILQNDPLVDLLSGRYLNIWRKRSGQCYNYAYCPGGYEYLP